MRKFPYISLFIALGVFLLTACTQSPTTASSTTPTAIPDTPVPESTATAVPSPTPELSPAQRLERGQEILLESLEAVSKAESFHFEVDGIMKTSSSGFSANIPISVQGDFQSPDRMKAETRISLGPLFSLEIETIVVGDAIYTKDLQTGQFKVSTRGGLDFVLPDPRQFTADSIPDDIVGIEFVGEKDLNGTGVYHLRGQLPQDVFGTVEGEASVDYWVGIEDKLVRKIETEADLSLENGDLGDDFGGISGDATLSMTMTFSAYNEPVTIEAPVIQ